MFCSKWSSYYVWHRLVQFGRYAILNFVPKVRKVALGIRELKFQTRYLRFHKSPNIFDGVEIWTVRCHVTHSMLSGVFRASRRDELEHCRQPTCIPIRRKAELFPKKGYRPAKCFFSGCLDEMHQSTVCNGTPKVMRATIVCGWLRKTGAFYLAFLVLRSKRDRGCVLIFALFSRNVSLGSESFLSFQLEFR